ncbi:transporter [Exophiala xenobiotica]|nr:transporter [Exophiala xenobiotica]KAK5238563.1 Filamentous Growth Regulator [Exophiala xenobiotica]KAK5246204.1 Filamentous Growth Regulator [Exophiala xenobiotica]KAK5349712.1 Filamentous Growth Regulator [Exophiala xenobiotica]KAK5387370.1 Filamentous Growth Regulator [Exophiala xenobiotica]
MATKEPLSMADGPFDDKKQGDLEAPMGAVEPGQMNQEILGVLDLDPALNGKMHLVNNALDEIGWTPYHWKLFTLTGFGYAVDALQLSLQGIIAVQAVYEFQPSYTKGLTIAVYIGMLVGALFWGVTADIIGRKIAFNVSLFICSIFTIVAGAAPNWASLGFFIAMAAFGAGGNLILDTTVFLEYLPSYKQYLVSCLAAWWGIGCTIAGLVAWAFMTNYSCADPSLAPFTPCTKDSNMGWRYLMYTMGAMIFVMSLLRVTVIRLKETPKFLLGQGHDAELVANLRDLAAKYNRPCSITLEQLEACGSIRTAHAKKTFSFGELWLHVSSLFSTVKIGYTTGLVWLSWAMIGLAYPLFNVFLPYYLQSRGVSFGVTSPDVTWRNYALVQVCGIFGPILGGYMSNVRVLGRRYTMVIGALLTMAFFFAYSQVTSQDQNVAYSCVISFTLEIYYAVLYGFTAEVLPSAHRATGNGIAVAFCRLLGAMSAVIATAANTDTSAPVFICAALYGALALCAFLFPFEPYGKRAS